MRRRGDEEPIILTSDAWLAAGCILAAGAVQEQAEQNNGASQRQVGDRQIETPNSSQQEQ